MLMIYESPYAEEEAQYGEDNAGDDVPGSDAGVIGVAGREGCWDLVSGMGPVVE
jgi:hypothetical protein